MIAYNAQNSYNQYRENSVMSAKPEELTLMLYNGLVKFIMRGKDAIEQKKMEDAHVNIVKAQNIIGEFIRTLDLQYEVSIGLELMYDYMLRRLMEANMHKDVSILDEVLGYARELRDTWELAIKEARKPVRASSAVATNEIPVRSAQ